MGDYFLDKAATKVNLLEKNQILLTSRFFDKVPWNVVDPSRWNCGTGVTEI